LILLSRQQNPKNSGIEMMAGLTDEILPSVLQKQDFVQNDN
jgi:hypothetical protein